MGQHASDWSRDLVTLTLDLGGHGACAIRTPSLKFVRLAIRKTWSTICVSIYGPGDLDLCSFDLKTGVRDASKVGNLPSKFGHARPLGSRIICYVCDGRTDRQTDKSNAYCPLPYGWKNTLEGFIGQLPISNFYSFFFSNPHFKRVMMMMIIIIIIIGILCMTVTWESEDRVLLFKPRKYDYNGTCNINKLN